MLASQSDAPADPIAEAKRIVENWRSLHDGHRYFNEHPRYQDLLHDLGVSRVRSLIDPKPEDTLLEIGCGYGRLLYHLLPEVKSVIGLDLARPPLEKAESLIRPLLADGQSASFVLGDGVTLDSLDEDCASVAVVFTVFQHMPKVAVKKYLVDLKRVLSPGGRVCFQVADGRPEHYQHDIRADLPREQSTRWSAGEVCDEVESAGLVVQRVERECLEATYPGRGMSWIWVLATV